MTTQCATCMHYIRRGGAVFASRMTCSELDGLPLPPPVVRLLLAQAASMARQFKCPNYGPLDWRSMPDAYLAQDLPLDPIPHHAITGEPQP